MRRCGSSAAAATTTRQSPTWSAARGLSVGAIYTHFSGKEALFLHSCDHVSARGLEELATRLARRPRTAERLAMAITLFIESIDDFDGDAGPGRLSRPGPRPRPSPAVRRCSCADGGSAWSARRTCSSRTASHGELPAWLDVDGIARAFLAMLDGLLLQRVEAGPSPAGRPARARPGPARRAAGGRRGGRARSSAPSPSRARSIRGHGPRPDRPRPRRPGDPGRHPAPRAHPDRAVAHRGALGLLAADPRCRADRHRARGVPGRGRRRASWT